MKSLSPYKLSLHLSLFMQNLGIEPKTFPLQASSFTVCETLKNRNIIAQNRAALSILIHLHHLE